MPAYFIFCYAKSVHERILKGGTTSCKKVRFSSKIRNVVQNKNIFVSLIDVRTLIYVREIWFLWLYNNTEEASPLLSLGMYLFLGASF